MSPISSHYASSVVDPFVESRAVAFSLESISCPAALARRRSGLDRRTSRSVDFGGMRGRGLKPISLPSFREILASERSCKPLLHSGNRLTGIHKT